MIRLYFKLTWPALILILVALALWLMRDRPVTHARRRSSTPTAAGPIIIDQTPAGDYAAETERLDREAAESGRRTFDDQQAQFNDFKERMNARNEQRYHARR